MIREPVASWRRAVAASQFEKDDCVLSQPVTASSDGSGGPGLPGGCYAIT